MQNMYSMLCVYTFKFVFNKVGEHAYATICFSLALLHSDSHYCLNTSKLDLILI